MVSLLAIMCLLFCVWFVLFPVNVDSIYTVLRGIADIGFGATSTGTGLFGQQQQQQQQQQSTGTSLFSNTAFGAAKPMFGAAGTTASTPFGGLSTAATGTTLFGQANQNKVSSMHCQLHV